MDDQLYYYARAEAELEMAQRAENSAAVKAHYDLANHYLERVYPENGEMAEAGTN